MKNQSTLLVFLMLSSIIVSVSKASDTCDCTKWPYRPAPPCFDVCFVETASSADSATLQKILGLDKDLAIKVTSLDDLDVSLSIFTQAWERSKLTGSRVELPNGSNVGTVMGYYRLPSTDQFYFAADNAQTNSVVGIPVTGAMSTDSNSIEESIKLNPHTPVYYAVDQPSWTGETIDIQKIPSWTSRQLNTDELQILRSKMKGITQSQFQELTQN